MGSTKRRAQEYRLLVLGLALVLVWVAVGVRLFDVQVVRAAEYEQVSLDQLLRSVELAPTRGTIYDREGRVLAFTVDAVSIWANPTQITDPFGASLSLAAGLGTSVAEIEEKLRRDTTFVFVERQVDASVAEAILDLEIPGVYGTKEPKRVYPAGSAVAHITGFVNIDGEGIEGLEYQYDEQLAGRSGFLQYESSLGGVPILQGDTVRVDDEPGVDLVTTVDLSLNTVAEQACASTLERTKGKRCSIVILEPSTGEILALVVTPGFDPENRGGEDAETLLARVENMAVRSLYEPGSVMKLVTISAAIQEGVVGPDHQLEVPPNIEFKDPSRPNDPWRFVDGGRTETEIMSVREIVARSSNVGTIMIQQRMGNAIQRQYLEAFGFGAGTGVDYSGEAVGQVNVDDTCTTCGPSAAIGYSVNTTLLQMASVFAAVANDGEWIQPHFVSEMRGPDGVETPDVARRRVLDESTAEIMRELLQGVIENERGTGRRAAVEGYSVGGKTGTSRVFEDGQYQDDRFMASFIGMAPIDDPRLVVAVLVEEPIEGYSGGAAAAPAFAEVMLKALYALGVEPDA